MTTSDQPKPVNDLSQRVVSMAREIDRLPPGNYTLILVKPDLPGVSWHFEIAQIVTIREMELPRKTTAIVE